MKTIITEELRYRQKAVAFAIKHNNKAEAARRYHTRRQQIIRWCQRYDGTLDSLRPKSRRPHHHPNAHTAEEIEIIKHCHRYYRRDGLAQVYVKCVQRGYKRHYSSMLKMIKRHCEPTKTSAAPKTYPKSKWKPEEVTYPGEKVQMDIKYIPMECIQWQSYDKRYYQITAIDEYSRKRVTQIVDEKSVTNTALFLLDLEQEMGFSVKTVQTDNGREFTNGSDQNGPRTIFEEILQEKGIHYQKTRPYSPWQNGKVERSHREDGEKFYSGHTFSSLEELRKKHQRYVRRQNNAARKVLNFKSPNEVIQEYFTNPATVPA